MASRLALPVRSGKVRRYEELLQDMLSWSESERVLYSDKGRFDPWSLIWEQAAPAAEVAPVGPIDALRRLRASGGIRRVPVGVIGPREAKDDERALAESLGRAIGELGLQLLCGGKSGVMEAACKGCVDAGGTPIGLIPDTEWQEANPYVAIPIATGIGVARNAVIARACLALVAVGGGYGTLSEMAFGLQFGRLVLALGRAPAVDGAVVCGDVGEAMERVAARILGCD
jgi:uncharacterized protein (TIGR00725 family)